MTMEYTHINTFPSRTVSRGQGNITTQEVLLEYSLVILVLGCFALVSLWFKFYQRVMDSDSLLCSKTN